MVVFDPIVSSSSFSSAFSHFIAFYLFRMHLKSQSSNIWERGQLGNSFHLLFVFLAHHFSMVMSLGLIFFSCFRPSSSECNPSLCILVHLASLYVLPSVSPSAFHPSPASYLQVHSKGDEPCIDKISPFPFFSSGVCLKELFTE